MINRFFKSIFTIKRMVWYEEFAEQEEGISFYGNIQNLSETLAQGLGMSLTNSFRIFVDINTLVYEQDELVDENNNKYVVKGIKLRDNGLNKHKELFVERQENFNQ